MNTYGTGNLELVEETFERSLKENYGGKKKEKRSGWKWN